MHVGRRIHVIDEVMRSRSPRGMGGFWEVLPIQEHCKSTLRTSQQGKSTTASAAVYAPKEIIQSSIAARHAMRPFIEILSPLVVDGAMCTLRQPRGS